MKAIKQAELNDILHKHFTDEISASKVVEYLNDLADEFAIGFAEWLSDWHTKERLKEILKSYKKEKGL